MIAESIKIMSSVIVDESVQWQNEYKPKNQINDAERVKFFTNFNVKLITRIRQIKTA